MHKPETSDILVCLSSLQSNTYESIQEVLIQNYRLQKILVHSKILSEDEINKFESIHSDDEMMSFLEKVNSLHLIANIKSIRHFNQLKGAAISVAYGSEVNISTEEKNMIQEFQELAISKYNTLPDAQKTINLSRRNMEFLRYVTQEQKLEEASQNIQSISDLICTVQKKFSHILSTMMELPAETLDYISYQIQSKENEIQTLTALTSHPETLDLTEQQIQSKEQEIFVLKNLQTQYLNILDAINTVEKQSYFLDFLIEKIESCTENDALRYIEFLYTQISDLFIPLSHTMIDISHKYSSFLINIQKTFSDIPKTIQNSEAIQKTQAMLKNNNSNEILSTAKNIKNIATFFNHSPEENPSFQQAEKILNSLPSNLFISHSISQPSNLPMPQSSPNTPISNPLTL